MSAIPRPLVQPAHLSGKLALRSRASRRSWTLDLALLSFILLLALGPRLLNLNAYSGLFDEGIRAEQLFLMAQGYRPFKEIFAAQGPLLLDSLYPLYALYGKIVETPLVAVRLVAVTYSLIGLTGLYWAGCQLAGRLGGFTSAFLLALSPLYLEGSRLALAEVPALAPAIVAVGCSLRYSHTGRPRWLIVAGLLVMLSFLMKPITMAVAPAVALTALLRGRGGLRDLMAVTLGVSLLSAVVVWLLGFNEVREQIVAYRQASREAAGWSLRKNIQALQAGLAFEPAALLPLAGLGGLILLASGWERSLPAVVWGLGGLGLLLLYSPLHGKHLVILVPGAALLAGAGWARAWHVLSRLAPDNRRLLAAGPLGVAGLWYMSSLAPMMGSPQSGALRVTADTDVDPAFEQYADAVAALRALTTADDFIVTDQPYLAFLAGRKVPPELVDTAISRVRSRSLTASSAQALAAAYNPKVVLLWGDRLRGLAAFKSWVETNYQVVKVYNRRGDTDRALYLRRDQDFSAARSLLGGRAAGMPGADFGGELRLTGAWLDRTELVSGQGATVTMLWEQLAETSIDYHVLVNVRGANGASLDSQQESLGAGSAGTSQWSPGRWLVQSSFVLTEGAQRGEYSVRVALYDSKARVMAPIRGSSGVGSRNPPAEGLHELVVGSLTVR